MFSFFRQTFRQWARSGTRTGAQKAPARRLQCEALEDRMLLSAASAEILVNATKPNVQHQAAVAAAGNGSSVVVWSEVKNSRDSDIKAQLFDAAHNKVGGEILVAGGRSPQHDPTVAMDANGNFTVAWTHDYSTTDSDIHAARFYANGTRNGTEVTIAGSPKREFDPSIGMAANGDFVVTYTYQFSSSDSDIKAIQYRANGTVSRTLEVAINSRKEEHSSVAVAADGRFAVAYVKSDDIVVQRYSKTGGATGTHIVANSTNQEREADLAMDNSGNVIVVWQALVKNNWDVFGRSISSAGVLGTTFTVQATTAKETLPSVAVDSLTGKFIVAYQSSLNTSTRVRATEFSASQAFVRTWTVGANSGAPSVSAGGTGHLFLIGYEALGAKFADSDGGIFARFAIP